MFVPYVAWRLIHDDPTCALRCVCRMCFYSGVGQKAAQQGAAAASSSSTKPNTWMRVNLAPFGALACFLLFDLTSEMRTKRPIRPR